MLCDTHTREVALEQGDPGRVEENQSSLCTGRKFNYKKVRLGVTINYTARQTSLL